MDGRAERDAGGDGAQGKRAGAANSRAAEGAEDDVRRGGAFDADALGGAEIFAAAGTAYPAGNEFLSKRGRSRNLRFLAGGFRGTASP